MARWWILMLAAGCYRPAETLCEGTACPIPDDVLRLDGPLPDGAVCVGRSPMEFCYPAPPQPTSFEISTAFDTDTCPQLVQDKNDVSMCIIVAQQITVAAGEHRITGRRPLVLVGTTSVELVGRLDLSGGSGNAPGSAPTACVSSERGTLAAGAGGGSFASEGGPGSTEISGSGGAAAPATSELAPFRGGCDGAASSSSQKGGAGGGAIYVASTAISVTPTGGINVGGGGGAASNSEGGTGGGTGGYIGLAAHDITFDGVLIATGGGGGGGSCLAGPMGGIGGTPTFSSRSAGGGVATGNAGVGGNGADGEHDAKPGGTVVAGAGGTCGGGGGGGGLGTIQLFVTIDLCPLGRCTPLAINNP